MIHNKGKISDSASLVLVGTGIKFMSHLTTEAKAYIQQSPKVLHLVNEPAMQMWIEKNNANAEALDPLYTKYPLRLHCYRAITEYILDTLRQQQHVCVVMYGHPTVFAQPGLAAIEQARKEGFYAAILPGISSESCLFADLLIDPGKGGCLSFETTEFLLRALPVEPTSHLILWQVGVIGALGHTQKHDNTKGATCLMERLLEYYPATHTLILYEAAQYPHHEPIIHEFSLKELPQAPFSRLTTLYVPPIGRKPLAETMLTRLGISKEDLK